MAEFTPFPKILFLLGMKLADRKEERSEMKVCRSSGASRAYSLASTCYTTF